MIVYITQARRTELSAVEVEGLPLWRLAVGGGFLARRRAAVFVGNTCNCEKIRLEMSNFGENSSPNSFDF